MEILTSASIPEVYHVESNGSNPRWQLIREIMGPFNRRPIKVPSIHGPLDFEDYGSLNYEHSTPEDEIIRQALVDKTLEQEQVEEGGANNVWCKSWTLKHITRFNGSFVALLDVYFGPSLEKEPLATREIGYRWADYNLKYLLDAKGSRNRKRAVIDHVRESIRAHTEGTEDKFRILSIAAGSSIAVLQAIYLEGERAKNVELTMVDLSKSAGEKAKEFARQLGIEQSLGEFIPMDIEQTGNYLKGRPWYHCIEKVGIDDYLKDEEEVALNTALRRDLVEGGTMIYANMDRHPEIKHLEIAVKWRDDMQYRNRWKLRKLGEAGGFSAEDLIDIEEPCGVYNIIVARKRTIA